MPKVNIYAFDQECVHMTLGINVSQLIRNKGTSLVLEA